MRPLDDVTVVALEQAVAAPFTSRQLADLGARVIKIERPGGGDFARSYDTTVHGLSSHFVWLNRSKESLTLDLKQPAGREVLERLVGQADVFIQNLAPGAATRLGFGPAELRARFPKLVTCEISGYGPSGPFHDRKAYDLMIQAEAGLLSITGSEAEPAKTGISVADIAAGMHALTAVLGALVARGRTGQGAAIQISMLEALGEWMGYPLYYTTYGGTPPSRTGARHAAIAPYGPFVAADQVVIYLGVQNEREWSVFCRDVLARPELADDDRFDSNPKRVSNLAALEHAVGEVFEQLPAETILTRLARAGIAHARANTIAELAAHPQLAARQRWRDVASPAGPIRSLVPPWTIEGVEPRLDPIPALGEHTDAILEELGYDPETVGAWRAAGVV